MRATMRHLARAGVMLALGAAPALAGGEDGWAAHKARRFKEAVRLWTPAANAGDPSAQFGLGMVYDLGQGVAPDDQAACDWYRRAGASGHAAAAFNTAVLYDNGRCGPRRADLAALWYARAAAAGHARAQFNIAQLYAAGDGVPRNPGLAASWFRVAAANGIDAAVSRTQLQPRAASPGAPRAVTPAGTDDAPPRAGGPAVLVWTAPPQPGPVRFFVEIAALDPGGPRELMAGYVDESAIQVRLPEEGTDYAWRVLTVSSDPPRYAAAPWQRLEVRP